MKKVDNPVATVRRESSSGSSPDCPSWWGKFTKSRVGFDSDMYTCLLPMAALSYFKRYSSLGLLAPFEVFV